MAAGMYLHNLLTTGLGSFRVRPLPTVAPIASDSCCRSRQRSKGRRTMRGLPGGAGYSHPLAAQPKTLIEQGYRDPCEENRKRIRRQTRQKDEENRRRQ